MPVKELGRAYKSIISRAVNLKYMSYVEVSGVQKFREILSAYLNDSRGLQTSFENIMITRGSQFGLYLITCVLFSRGENIIVGDTNYYYADHCFLNAGMHLIRVKVDESGIDVDAIEKICQKKDQSHIYNLSPSLSHYGYVDRIAQNQIA
jgi:GntR family transcriptional regulator/MocR family aminotransferase